MVAALALVPAVAAASIAFMSKSPLRGFGGLMLLAINIGFIILTGGSHNNCDASPVTGITLRYIA